MVAKVSFPIRIGPSAHASEDLKCLFLQFELEQWVRACDAYDREDYDQALKLFIVRTHYFEEKRRSSDEEKKMVY